MFSLRRIVVGSVLGSIVALTATEAQAQPVLRAIRFGRATISPTFDVQGVVTNGPPAGPVAATSVDRSMPSGPAEIRVIGADSSARIRVNGQEIGPQGVFVTPPLEAGWAYTFHVTCDAPQGSPGHQTTVAVIAGERQLIDFRMGGSPQQHRTPLRDTGAPQQNDTPPRPDTQPQQNDTPPR